MTPAKAGYAIQVSWFNVRKHLTKALGILAIIVGYALENEATWVVWLSETKRGTVTKYFGVVVFVLGLYNHLYPPERPMPPFDPLIPGDSYNVR